MATGYGEVQRLQFPYVSPFDWGLVMQGMAYKQSKYDANAAQIQTAIDGMTGIDLAKEADREYFYGKMSGLVSDVNAWVRNADLSSDGITRSIRSHITGALNDNRVMNGIVGTKYLRKYQEEVDWVRRNKPEQYSTVNEMFGMEAFEKWLNDGEAGSKPVQSRYTPYRDVSGDVDKKMMELQKMRAGGQKVTRPDPNNPGYMMEMTVDRMTEPEIWAYIRGGLNEADRKQLEINAWYNLRANPEAYSAEGVKAYAEKETSVYDAAIGSLKARRAGAGADENARKQFDAQIEELTREKDRYKLSVQEFTDGQGRYDPRRAAQYMTFQRLLDEKGKQWAYNKTSVEYNKDNAYWAGLDYGRQINNDRIEAERWDKRYELDLKKYDLDYLKYLDGDQPSGNARSRKNVYGESEAPKLSDSNFNYGEKETVSKLHAQDLERYDSDFNGTMEALKKSLDAEQLAGISALVDEEMKKPDNAGKSFNEVMYDQLTKTDGVGHGYVSDNVTSMGLLFRARNAKDYVAALQKDDADIAKSYRENVLDSADARRALAEMAGKSNHGIFDPNSNAFVKVKDFYQNGDMSKERKISYIQASALAENLLEKVKPNPEDPHQYLDTAPLSQNKGYQNGSYIGIDSNAISLIDQIGERLGEKLSWRDMFDRDSETGVYKLKSVDDKDSFAAKLVKNVFNEYGASPYISGLYGIDFNGVRKRRLIDNYKSGFDNDIKGLVIGGRDNTVLEVYGNRYSDKNVRFKDQRFDEKTTGFAVLSGLYDTLYTQSDEYKKMSDAEKKAYGNVEGLKKGTLVIENKNDDPKRRWLYSSVTGASVPVSIRELADIEIDASVDGMPQLTAGMRFQPRAAENITFPASDDILQLLGTNGALQGVLRESVFRDDALNMLFDNFRDVLYDESGKPNEKAEVIRQAMEHPDRFIVRPTPSGMGYKFTLLAKSGQGGEAAPIISTYQDIPDWGMIQAQWNVTPQSFFVSLLSDILQRERKMTPGMTGGSMTSLSSALGKGI
jgi:hypothetical protein